MQARRDIGTSAWEDRYRLGLKAGTLTCSVRKVIVSFRIKERRSPGR